MSSAFGASRTKLLLLTLIFVVAMLSLPSTTHAQNAMCMGGWDPSCPCNTKKDAKTGQCVGGENKFMCPCQESTPVGPVTGKCEAPGKCKASKAPGEGGKGNALDAALQQLGKMLGDILGKLMQGGGQGGQGQQPQPQTGAQQSCASYTPTKDPNAPSTNPCLYYSPNVSDSLTNLNPSGNSISDLLGQLNSTNGSTNVSDQLTGTSVSTGSSTTNASTQTGTSVGTGGSSDEEQNRATTVSDILSGITGGAVATLFGGTQKNNGDQSGTNATTPQSIVQTVVQGILPLGAYGDIKLLNDGTTIVFGNREQNTEVAGFYGASTLGTQPQGLVSNMCATRPWASTFISYIVPPSFFDSLCAWRGYKVGMQGAALPHVTVVQQQMPAKSVINQKPATTTAQTESRVDIWVAPEAVPLGARTSVFWNTQNVTKCTETSPDGSFSHSTLSGGASTVTLTHDTVFTISCLKSDGMPITDTVTVRIAI